MEDMYLVVCDQITKLKINFVVKTKMLNRLSDMFCEDADVNQYVHYVTMARIYESAYQTERERYEMDMQFCTLLASSSLETEKDFLNRMIGMLPRYALV